MKFHRYAEIFPLMTDDEIDELAEDIKTHGQKQSIWLYDGKVLDGRNRWQACKIAKIEPKTLEYKGKDPLGLVISLNLKRRQLTTSQRAAAAVEIKKAYAALNPPGQPKKELASKDANSFDLNRKSAEIAAGKLGVSLPSVERAARIERYAPKDFEKIKAGEMTVGKAHAKLKARKAGNGRGGMSEAKKDALAVKDAGKIAVDAQRDAQRILKFEALYMNSILPLVRFNKDCLRVFRKNNLDRFSGVKFRSVLRNLDDVIEALESWHPDQLKKCPVCDGTRNAPTPHGPKIMCEECAQGRVGEAVKYATKSV